MLCMPWLLACHCAHSTMPEEPAAASIFLETGDAESETVGPQTPSELPPAWWTPLPTVSLDTLTTEETTAADHCVTEHRLPELSATSVELLAGAACLLSARAFGRAALVYQHLLRRYPSSPEAMNALRTVGRLYEQVGRISDALDAHRKYLSLYSSQAEARTLGQRAVCLARHLGDQDAVEQLLQTLDRSYASDGFIRPPPIAFPQLCAGLPAK